MIRPVEVKLVMSNKWLPPMSLPPLRVVKSAGELIR